MSTEETPIIGEPLVELTEVGEEVTSSWPGVVQIETGLGYMRSMLGDERYRAQIELQMGFGTHGNTRARMVGHIGTPKAPSPVYKY